MKVRVRFLLPEIFGITADSYVIDVDGSCSVLDLIKRLGEELSSEILTKAASAYGGGLLVIVNDNVVGDINKLLRQLADHGNELNVVIAPTLEGG